MLSLSFFIFGILYLALGLGLFLLNLVVYEKLTPFKANDEIFDIQNKALGHVIRGQLIGQGIMISMIMYFLGSSYDHGLSLTELAVSFGQVAVFGAIGVVLLQSSLLILAKYIPLEKEIIKDKNESLGMVVEAFLIALSLIMSVAIFSY